MEAVSSVLEWVSPEALLMFAAGVFFGMREAREELRTRPTPMPGETLAAVTQELRLHRLLLERVYGFTWDGTKREPPS